MTSIVEIFEEMRKSPMNDWVGGSDPEIVGDAAAHIIRRLVPLENGKSRVLDFGCGIGRGLVALRKSGVAPAQIVGMDIMPPVVDFCNTHIQPHLDNVQFELIDDKNDHYDRFIADNSGKNRAQVSREYSNHFTAGYAFSVFTHVTREDFGGLLKLVSSMMVPGGRFLLTYFELNEFSRFMIRNGQPIFPLDNRVMKDNDNIMIANDYDPLAFIAFDRSLVEQMVWDAGMAITKVEYGCWMGGQIGSSLQDVMVCTKLPELTAKDSVKMTPMVDRSKMA